MRERKFFASVDPEHQDSAEVLATLGHTHVNPAFPTRIAALDGLRGLAVATVFVHHAFHVKLLWMGVDLFFVLSGFLITTILLKQKEKPFGAYIGHFYARRARRILPAYVVFLLLTAALFGLAWLRYWYFFFGAMNFMVPMNLQYPKTLWPTWSLAVEEQFYLVWPLTVYFLRRKPLFIFTCGLLAIAPTLRYVCAPLFQKQGVIYNLTPFRMDTLAAGALLALLWPSIESRMTASPRFKWKVGAASSTVIVLAVGSLALFRHYGISTDSNTPFSNLSIYEATLAICVSAFLIALVGIGKTFLSSWPMVWLGRISYSIYLVHVTVLYFLPGHKAAVPAALLTIAYALGMWHLIEKPNPLLSLSHWRKA